MIFEENPSAFNHPDLKILLGLSSNPKDLKTPYSLNSSYFIEANLDNNTKFKKLKTLLTKFDYEEELLINFSNKELDDIESESKDRAYWEEKINKESLKIIDDCINIINEFEPKLRLNYTQSYVGLTEGLKRQNFVIFVPKQEFVRAEIHISENEIWFKKLENANFTVNSIGKKGRIKVRINKTDLLNQRDLIKKIFETAYGDWI